MNIACYLYTDGIFETAILPEKLFLELVKSLRTKGRETVHFPGKSIEVEGVFIPAKGMNTNLMIVPFTEE